MSAYQEELDRIRAYANAHGDMAAFADAADVIVKLRTAAGAVSERGLEGYDEAVARAEKAEADNARLRAARAATYEAALDFFTACRAEIDAMNSDAVKGAAVLRLLIQSVFDRTMTDEEVAWAHGVMERIAATDAGSDSGAAPRNDPE